MTAEQVHDRLVEVQRTRPLKLVIGESFTGGLVHDALIAQSGSSAYLLGGLIFYDPQIKLRLGLDPADVDDESIATASTAAKLAAGLRDHFSSMVEIETRVDLALATTGWAGPTAPPGLVGNYAVALATPTGVESIEGHLGGSRAEVRQAGVEAALTLLGDWLSR